MEWLRRAACVGHRGRRARPRPVATQCLAPALELGQASGVWGGACEEERVALLHTGQGPAVRNGGSAARLP
ncbi:WhiB family transcriptional regulator [Streptomyces flaveolus]|uniref:WhiB family transcriptional regulator n=1 Tax=Streptomyces flaveolus TaxID=67297 RepID=UPI003325D0C7